MQKMQLLIGQVLKIGVFLAFFIVLIGSILYLFQHGSEMISLQKFSTAPLELKSTGQIFSESFAFSPLGIIQLGLLVLVLLQIVRVALTLWLFIQLQEIIFILISLFILFVLIYSLFLHAYT